MSSWFEHLPPELGALVVIGGFIALTFGFGRGIARYSRQELLREHNELAGFIFAVVGVIYAVILGLIAAGVWERYVNAEVRTFDEASRLTNVYRDAGAFPNATSIRKDLRTYVKDVITLSWP